MTHKPFALTIRRVIECTMSDFPEELMDEVRQMWVDMEFGNDHYYYEWDCDEDEEQYPKIASYLKELDDVAYRTCLIHWWW